MAGNIFDQIDPPAQGRNIFDEIDPPAPVRPQQPQLRVPEYDPMAVAVQSLNARNYAEDNPQVVQAQAGAVPSVDGKGAGASLYQGHKDTEAAQRQHAAPLVRDIKGNFVRKPLGEIEEFDFGPMIRTGDGKTYAFNPKSDVMLRDPQSGKLMAFERSEELDNPNIIARAGQALLPGMVAGAPTRIASSNAVPMAVQRGAALGFPVPTRTFQLGERARDAAAFNVLDTEPFAPAFRSKGAARFARTVEEMPVLGGIVKNPKTETELALQQSQARIVSDLGAATTDETAGRVLQTGLDRFKTARISDIEPGALPAGIPAWERAQRPIFTLSKEEAKLAPQAEAAAVAAGGRGVPETMRGAQASVSPIKEVSRRSASDMSIQELQAIARRPAGETSFATRQEALYELADRKIPDFFKIDGSANAGLISTPASGGLIKGLLKAEESIKLQGGVAEGRYSRLSEALKSAQRNFTIDSLKKVRTEVGRALGSFGEYETNWHRTDLKQLYAAVTQDIQSGYHTLANRAWRQTTVSSNRPDHITPEVARAADKTLYEFKRADRYTRIGIERMDRFSKLLNAESPEAAVRTLATRMKEGKLDRGMVRSVRDALRPEERNQVLGYLVARMGEGRPGAREAEAVWNLHGFATDWNANKTALALLAKGAPQGVVDRLNALARVSERMKYYETTKNYSGSAYAGIPFAGALTGVVGGGPLIIPTLVASVGGLAAMGKFLTTPRYLDWMVQAASTGAVPRAGGPQVGGSQMVAQLERLRALAANDNELGPVITKALELLTKRPPAAEGENPERQPQQ